MLEAVFYSHQGWTDIINCLGLINYYQEKYNKLFVLMRYDSKKMIDFYVKNLSNIEIIYFDKNFLDTNNIINYLKDDKKYDKVEILFHGIHDIYRTDDFNSKYPNAYFVEAFYTSYNINYLTRINNFLFTRDYELEDKIYNNFINKYTINYILHHEIFENNSNYKDLPYINLNNISEIFFDYIKVLENAKEIHLLDSVWGALIYQLDCKYKLFQNKKIYIYCKRGYKKMFIEPIKLENWIFC